jgi:hypothetical protein
MMVDYQHEVWCQHTKDNHESARRVADTYNLHMLADPDNARGKWFAAKLEDGRSDGVLYDDKLSCVLHQHHNERYYTFIRINPSSMNPCEAQVMLNTARLLYKNGARMADPDHKHGGPSVIRRLLVEDQLAMMRGSIRNLEIPGYPRERRS